MENQEVLYETLSPLYVDATAEQTPPPSPSRSDNLEQYVVFRNEISLYSTQCPLPEATAQDYFSLHADEEVDELKLNSFSTPPPASVPVPVKEPARTIEGNWFRANCSFRSPMLQLHKGIDCLLFGLA